MALGQTRVHAQRQRPAAVPGRRRRDGLGGAARALQRARPDGGERLLGEPPRERLGLAQAKVGQRRVGAALQPPLHVAHRLGAAGGRLYPGACAARGVSWRDAAAAAAAVAARTAAPARGAAPHRRTAPVRRHRRPAASSGPTPRWPWRFRLSPYAMGTTEPSLRGERTGSDRQGVQPAQGAGGCNFEPCFGRSARSYVPALVSFPLRQPCCSPPRPPLTRSSFRSRRLFLFFSRTFFLFFSFSHFFPPLPFSSSKTSCVVVLFNGVVALYVLVVVVLYVLLYFAWLFYWRCRFALFVRVRRPFLSLFFVVPQLSPRPSRYAPPGLLPAMIPPDAWGNTEPPHIPQDAIDDVIHAVGTPTHAPFGYAEDAARRRTRRARRGGRHGCGRGRRREESQLVTMSCGS